ncbi:MAG: AMP-binding protein, partial [bacterium]|nr:AMP-binding protein [bacterium]
QPHRLASLKRVFASGESLKPNHVETFNTLIGNVNKTKLINLYGPTEATVDVTYYNCPTGGAISKIPIGKPIDNTQLYILSPSQKIQPIGVVGELYLSGAGLARGYLNKPELTVERFVQASRQYAVGSRQEEENQNAIKEKEPEKGQQSKLSRTAPLNKSFWESGTLFSKRVLAPGGPPEACFYRTGDLARWMPDGNVEYLGRIDHQVKIRGIRIELGEIEKRLQQHENIKEATVLARENGNDETYLCAYYVSGHTDKKTDLHTAALGEHLGRTLPDYMIPAAYMELETFPLTPNGKIDRKQLPQPEIKTAGEYIAPTSENEKKLVGIWTDILNIPWDKISMEADFFQLGGHSLKAAVMTAKIHKIFDVKIPLTTIFKKSTPRKLNAIIETTAKERYRRIEKTEKKEYYHLTSAQKRLYLLYRMDPANLTYNMPQNIPLPGGIDKKRLTGIIHHLIRRHESLRTTFHMVEEQPVQVIREPEDIEFDLQTIENPQEGQNMRDFVQPFELTRAPLLRVGVIENSGTINNLMVDMHHIISDGVSQGILEKEFTARMKGEQLPPLRLQYRDYAEWQKDTKQKELIKEQEHYWLEAFSGELPVLKLPEDYPRPVMQQFEGRSLQFFINRPETAALKKICKETGTTIYMIVLAALNTLFAKLSGQEDIIIGTPAAARRHADMQEIFGMFVATLAMRNYPEGRKTFIELLKEIKDRTLKAYENQEYPFEKLVDRVSVSRDTGRNPLFDVMLNYLNQAEYRGNIDRANLDAIEEQDETTALFDLTFEGTEVEGAVYITLTYCTKIFKKETIKRFILYLKKIISSINQNPQQRLADIEILTEEEQQRLLFEFNDTAAENPKPKPLHELFEEQAQRIPDRIAVAGLRNKPVIEPGAESTLQRLSFTRNLMQITYRELNERAEELANRLKEKGITPGTITGLAVPPSPETVIAVMAIWKAGGTYLPVDLTLPVERIKYMLADSSAAIILTGEATGMEHETTLRELGHRRLPGDRSSNTHFEQNINERQQEPLEIHESPLQPTGNERLTPVDLWAVESSRQVGLHETRNRKTTTPNTAYDTAYVIYTSGTTGKPKGVMVPHSAFINRLNWLQNRYGFDSSDVFIQKTPLTFDVSVCELFRWIPGGGRMIIMKPGDEKDPAAIQAAVKKHHATTIEFVPSMLNFFLDYIENNKAKIGGSTLKWVFVGAEPLQTELVKKFKRIYETIETRLINAYGPTEATVDITSFDCSAPDGPPLESYTSVPIGKPIQNTQIYILDKYGNIQPERVPGELCIGGKGLALGYLNNPELTAERF